MILSIDIAGGSDSKLSIGENIGLKTRCGLVEIFCKQYVKPERPSKPQVYSEMKINLSDNKPFGFSSSRLSYNEKSELQFLLDDYLEKVYIRSSDSEFASPIVLVRKKKEIYECVSIFEL